VIAIIGILIALLLPAVQAAREAARRTQCQNNLRQYGIAVHNHVDVNNKLPSYGVTSGGNATLSWNFRLLPFMEQQAVYEKNTPNWTISVLGAASLNDWRSRSLPFENCPSHGGGRCYIGGGATYERAQGCYAANMGQTDYSQNAKTSPAVASQKAPFQLNVAVDIALPDGTSQTICVAEVTPPQGDIKSPGYTRIGEVKAITGAGFTAFLSPNNVGGDYIDRGHAVDMMKLIGPPGRRPTVAANSVADFRSHIIAARSYHPAGVNVVSCDSSGKFVSETIDIGVWRASSTSDGGEALSLP
jgi:type II secretory pathway pseudopilin PulG